MNKPEIKVDDQNENLEAARKRINLRIGIDTEKEDITEPNINDLKQESVKVELVSDAIPDELSIERKRELEKLRADIKRKAEEVRVLNGISTTTIQDGIINNVTIEELRSVLQCLGVTIDTWESSPGRHTVAIHWSKSRIAEIVNRRGGRPTKVFHTKYTVGQIFDALAATDPRVRRQDLYDVTGMSKTTFHKRVAYYREHGTLNDEFC